MIAAEGSWASRSGTQGLNGTQNGTQGMRRSNSGTLPQLRQSLSQNEGIRARLNKVHKDMATSRKTWAIHPSWKLQRPEQLIDAFEAETMKTSPYSLVPGWKDNVNDWMKQPGSGVPMKLDDDGQSTVKHLAQSISELEIFDGVRPEHQHAAAVQNMFRAFVLRQAVHEDVPVMPNRVTKLEFPRWHVPQKLLVSNRPLWSMSMSIDQSFDDMGQDRVAAEKRLLAQ